ncbi:uncharacterized protein CMU_021790 [Cryptosporidium muris RN66]|uniref:Protein kinase domain-containing protein n=1 Tax=Cryptosporidium muris (strain RN66) TaxID=441375 RepID=B6AJM4_CRYMR|nr:uncharacterized protein CMU_021790 [Cryptosporidium muris RN66]EEA08415.1 hypothetical protein, conserved [Cryptosporidium muris RN66]|eukprot:XP_002142764.1 hypothetical protein [Cryptosporidium muris RN66]
MKLLKLLKLLPFLLCVRCYCADTHLIGFSEKELLSTLCLSLPPKFMRCEIYPGTNIYGNISLPPVPVLKPSSTSESVFGVMMFPINGGYATYGVLSVRPKYNSITVNSFSSSLQNVPVQLIQSSVAMFGLPYQATNVVPSTHCTLAPLNMPSNPYSIISLPNMGNNFLHRHVPENIILKANPLKSMIRDMFYTSFLANSEYPVKPTASYGMGFDHLVPAIVCFSSNNQATRPSGNQQPFLGGVLITERIMGPSLRDAISFLRSSKLKEWVESSKSTNIFIQRISFRLEAQYSLAHAFIAALLTLQYHSPAGRLLHCDLTTRSIHFDGIPWDWSNNQIAENLQSLTFLSPRNVRFSNFAYMYSTLEVVEEKLRCHHSENDLFRVQQFIKSLFYDQCKRTDFPPNNTLQSVFESISLSVKTWWNGIINSIGEPIRNTTAIDQQLIQIQQILRVIHTDPLVINSINKMANFEQITQGIKTIHSAVSEAFNILNSYRRVTSRNRNMVPWSYYDLVPFPVQKPNKRVQSILNGQLLNAYFVPSNFGMEQQSGSMTDLTTIIGMT